MGIIMCRITPWYENLYEDDTTTRRTKVLKIFLRRTYYDASWKSQHGKA